MDDKPSILGEVFCRHISLHGGVFPACAVVAQLTIEISEMLLDVEYTLEYKLQ